MSESAPITLLDYILLPIFLGVIYGIAYSFRNRHYKKNHPWRKYFIPALTVKIIGAIFIGLVYYYYYTEGDTIDYFHHGQIINSSINESFGKWINLLFRLADRTDGEYYTYISQMHFYKDPPSYAVGTVSALLSLFTLNTYLPTAVLFAVVSFTGIWALFRTFASLLPKLTNPVAIAVLFIPSVFVWGSGIFKDTICIFGIGWLTYSCFRFLLKGDFSIRNIAIAVGSFLVIANVKLYIIMAFTPALLMWVFFNYTQKIENPATKKAVKFIFLSIVIGATTFFLQQFSSSLGKYSLDNISKTAETTREYLNWISGDEGSAYSLGEVGTGFGGMLAKFPAAVNVTLFRPYPWEAKKVIVFLSAIEAILFVFITLKVLFIIGLRKTWTTISKDPTIQFCLIFSFIFAFAVGITSYNFGTLSRYKIPCLPFYALAIILIWYKNKPLKQKLIRILNI
jgi:hypothetical protein